MTETENQGWAWPFNSQKAHYFVNARSLCGRWGFFGEIDMSDQGPGNKRSDCAACMKKLEKRHAR
jgi:hypothetical protein